MLCAQAEAIECSVISTEIANNVGGRVPVVADVTFVCFYTVFCQCS